MTDGLVLLLLAPIIGSFLGAVVLRTVRHDSFIKGRSRCDGCGHPLAPAELIPIASYLAQGGRCRACKAPIGSFHLLIELAAIAVPALALAVTQDPLTLIVSCGLGWTLLTLAWIDAKSLRLPDALTLPLILAGLAEAAWLDPDALTGRALGAALAYTAFRLLAWAYRTLRNRDGLGQGDAKLLAAAGAWIGVGLLADVVLLAAVSGLLFAGLLRLRGRSIDSGTAMPFGPFLAAGLWATWLNVQVA